MLKPSQRSRHLFRSKRLEDPQAENRKATLLYSSWWHMEFGRLKRRIGEYTSSLLLKVSEISYLPAKSMHEMSSVTVSVSFTLFVIIFEIRISDLVSHCSLNCDALARAPSCSLHDNILKMGKANVHPSTEKRPMIFCHFRYFQAPWTFSHIFRSDRISWLHIVSWCMCVYVTNL